MKILIAEDDRVSRRILEKILVDFGHEVVSASDGREALERYREARVKFAILDWVMPELDGLELCKHIRLDEEEVNKGSEEKARWLAWLRQV